MPNASPLGKYRPILQLIHWLIALLVACQFAIAITLGQLRSLQYGQYVLGLHRQLGFAILLVSLLRLALLVRHRGVSPNIGLPSWQLWWAHLVHFAFYAVLVAQPGLGICLAWARGDAVTVFGIFTLPAPWNFSDAARDRFMAAHIGTAILLLSLVIIHLGAVIFNHWKRRVPVMDRMLPSVPADQFVNRVPVAVLFLTAPAIVIVIALATGINAIAKYRAFSQMTQTYQDTEQAAADETRAAQSAWKEIVGIGAAPPAPASAARLHAIAETARSHLEGAAAQASDPDSRIAIAAIGAQIERLMATSGSFSTSAIGDVDLHLQDLGDAQVAAAQQIRGDIAERASRGHDLIVVTVVPMAVLGIVLSLFLARNMSSSVRRLRILVRGIENEKGKLDIRIHGRGEYAELMRDMVSMRAAIERRTQLAAEQRFALETDRVRVADEQQKKQREMELERAAELQALQQRQGGERRALREQLAREFETQIAGIVDSVAVTIEALKSTATNLAQSAASTTQSSSEASAIAEKTKDSASRIADSSAQLSKAAQSVREHAEQSKRRAVTGAREATAAQAEIDSLAAASGEISSIAVLIAGVTRQINLLAINARIEAARAGEAGRGFCVVADEVKNLAAQTQSATDGIGGHVHQVGSAATRSIAILQSMGSIIGDLEAGSSTIYEVCNEQSTSTDIIASKVSQISASTVSVAKNIAHAERTARATETMACDVVETANLLQSQADSLQDQVANFVLQLTSVASRDVDATSGSMPQTEIINGRDRLPAQAR